MTFQCSEDSWSEEGEVSSDDGGRHGNRGPGSVCSSPSSDGNLSEEENTSEVSMTTAPDGLLSTNSSENLEMELSKYRESVGLGDIDGQFRRVGRHSSPLRSFEVISAHHEHCHLYCNIVHSADCLLI